MTINEYFSHEQPINDEVVDEVYYAKTKTIKFGGNSSRYAKIEIAHIGENLWAFGWEISDGSIKYLKRHCTIHSTTKGNINKLIYGMTKVLRRQLENTKYHSQFTEKLIDKAIGEASAYCQCDKSGADAGKITI